jgi:hypothetical protein
MSSVALNQVYKTGILAVEECTIVTDLAEGATGVAISGAYMSPAPFVVGRKYIIRDESFTPGANGVPNAEWVTVREISGVVVTPRADGIGYDITGTLAIVGNGSLGGTANAYRADMNASILTPGQEVVIRSEDFNCRFKTISDAPKIDFDDEAERFATGDEGRDQSIPGARSGEITFTQKLAWAGAVYTMPVWAKLMRSMGHLAKRYGFGLSTSPTTSAGLSELFTNYSLILGSKFYSADGTDTGDASLLAAKGSVVKQGDSFVVTDVSPEAVSYINMAGIGFFNHTWANEVTATIWVIAPENGMAPTTTVYRYCGAHGGNASSLSTTKVGDVYMLTGKYSAAYIGTIELPVSATRALTAPETNIPEVMLNNLVTVPVVFGNIIPKATTPTANCASYATVAALVAGENLAVGMRFYSADGTDTVDGALTTAKGSPLVPGDAFEVDVPGTACHYVEGVKNIEISQFSLDFGGIVNSFIDQATSTGNAYYATQDRDPRLSINPYHVKKTLDDIDSVVTNARIGAVIIKSSQATPHITIECPNSQLLSPALASREGYINTNRVYRPLRNKITSTPANAALPDQVMYEILIGSRS